MTRYVRDEHRIVRVPNRGLQMRHTRQTAGMAAPGFYYRELTALEYIGYKMSNEGYTLDGACIMWRRRTNPQPIEKGRIVDEGFGHFTVRACDGNPDEDGTYAGHDLGAGINDLFDQWKARYGRDFEGEELDAVLAEALGIAARTWGVEDRLAGGGPT